jgi:hypothetical protein
VDETRPIVVYPSSMTSNPYAAPVGLPTPKPNRPPLIIAGLDLDFTLRRRPDRKRFVFSSTLCEGLAEPAPPHGKRHE